MIPVTDDIPSFHSQKITFLSKLGLKLNWNSGTGQNSYRKGIPTVRRLVSTGIVRSVRGIDQLFLFDWLRCKELLDGRTWNWNGVSKFTDGRLLIDFSEQIQLGIPKSTHSKSEARRIHPSSDSGPWSKRSKGNRKTEFQKAKSRRRVSQRSKEQVGWSTEKTTYRGWVQEIDS